MPKAEQDSLFKFPRTNRLLSKKDFQFVFAKPYKIQCTYLLGLYRPNGALKTRLGVIVSKQHVKRAIDRNCLRRRVRESFRLQRQALETHGGLDIIVLMRAACSSLALHAPVDKHNLRQDINNLWLKMAHG